METLDTAVLLGCAISHFHNTYVAMKYGRLDWRAYAGFACWCALALTVHLVCG